MLDGIELDLVVLPLVAPRGKPVELPPVRRNSVRIAFASEAEKQVWLDALKEQTVADATEKPRA